MIDFLGPSTGAYRTCTATLLELMIASRACSSEAEQGAHNLMVAGSNPARPTELRLCIRVRSLVFSLYVHCWRRMTDAAEFARKIAQIALDTRATNIVVLDISQLSPITDVFVVCSVDNARQLGALFNTPTGKQREDGSATSRRRRRGGRVDLARLR